MESFASIIIVSLGRYMQVDRLRLLHTTIQQDIAASLNCLLQDDDEDDDETSRVVLPSFDSLGSV